MRKRRRDLTDLLGSSEEEEVISFSSAEVHKVAAGVSTQWLARVFRITRHNVEKKVIDLRPVGQGKYGNPLYDFVEAAELLVTPKVDVEKYVASLKPNQLPEKLRETYWNSMLKRQRWEEKAGHLWSTEKVIERISDMLLEIRTVLQILPERIEREAGLSEEQHRVARSVVDGLQNELYERLSAFAKKTHTPSQLGEESDDEDDLL